MKVVRGGVKLVKAEKAPSSSMTIPLSSSDLIVPRVHVEVLYAFAKPSSPPAHLLVSGLAKVLSVYPEWMGRLGLDEESGRPAILVDESACGVPLVEAEADVELLDLMPFHPSAHLLQLIPPNRGIPELLLVQLTKFTCGGLALGVARHHQVADGTAASNFMDAWACSVKGLLLSLLPSRDRSILMPNNPPLPQFEHIEYSRPPPKPVSAVQTVQEYPELVIKKVHFSPEVLKKIKKEAATGASGKASYTTFESLVAHLWRSITDARGLEGSEETKVMVSMDVRQRLTPPLPQGYFGNAICHACPLTSVKELLSQPLSFAAGLIHNAIKRVDNEYLRSALDFVELQRNNPTPVARSSKTVLKPNLSVTSWVHLPLYHLDFGFGTPVFAGNPFIPFEGLIVLAPSHTRDGGIDVVLGLFAPDMVKFEHLCFNLNGLKESSN